MLPESPLFFPLQGISFRDMFAPIFLKFQRLTARAAHPDMAKNFWNHPGEGNVAFRAWGAHPGAHAFVVLEYT